MHFPGRTVGTLNGQEKSLICGNGDRVRATARSRCGVPAYWLATSVGAQMIDIPRCRAASRALFILGTRAAARCALVMQSLVFHISTMMIPIFDGSTASLTARMRDSRSRVCRANEIGDPTIGAAGKQITHNRGTQAIFNGAWRRTSATGWIRRRELGFMFGRFSYFGVALSK